MGWDINWYREGGGGGVTIVNLLKETEMEVTANQKDVNTETRPQQIGVEFSVEMIKKEVKIETIWQKN